MASDLVTATRPPLVSTDNAAGRLLSAFSTSAVETLTTWPLPRSSMCSIVRVVTMKETGEVDGDQSVEVLECVVREGLADVQPGVVDQGVDPTKALDRRPDDPLRGFGVGDVALDGDDARVVSGFDRPSRRDHGIPALAVRLREARADPLRGAGDDRDLPVVVLSRRDHSTG